MRREQRLEVFEIRIEHSAYNDRNLLSFRSRVFDLHYNIELRRGWNVDPRRLADFIEELVGGTLHTWDRLRVRGGREMAHELMPHWERAIHHYMERLEYEGSRREVFYSRMQDPRQWIVDDFGWDGPREDPKATEKARQILMRNLDDGQQKSFKKDQEFRVTGKDGKVYRITHARSFNVIGPDGAKYCGQLRDCPIEDQMLAQKLLLEHEPDKFFKNANVSPARPASPLAEPPRYMGMDWARL